MVSESRLLYRLLFDSPEAQQTVINDMDGVAPEEPIEEDPQPEECSTDAAACSFLPPKLFHYVKPPPKPKKRVRETFQRLSFQRVRAPQPTPPVLDSHSAAGCCHFENSCSVYEKGASSGKAMVSLGCSQSSGRS